MKLLVLLTMLGLLMPAALRAQGRHSVDVRVTETAGIRRTTYPTASRIHFERGALADPAHVRLIAGGKDVPAQVGVESRYPDGSIQWLTVDFNVSLGPLEQSAFQLEYGDGVEPAPLPRGLSVVEDAGGIQVGSVRFNAAGAPLLLSVKYRKEDIGQGQNGFAIVDTAGVTHEASSAEQLKMDVVKRGPFIVQIRYRGELRLTPAYTVGYVMTVEMPNSKSWIKVSTAVADPEKRVRELSFHTPLALGAQPWTWDFGTGSWSYGLLRNSNESVTLTQSVGAAQSTKWEIRSGANGQEQAGEVSGGRRGRLAEGWGHIQDQSEAVAFAIPDFGAEAGTYTCALSGNGQLSFRWVPARALPHLQLTVYEHFVATPVPVGAVTSPVSMLNPLVVSVSNPR
jgi:hypothetical protein